MTPSRFRAITRKYPNLRVAVVGDFCLDRYLDIDSAKSETSLETGLRVENVVKVRAQAGGAGTILNNLAALGVGKIYPIGFCGQDGEGFELLRALKSCRSVDLRYFFQTDLRHTFTYCKPMRRGRELNRLDIKNWTETPSTLQIKLANSLLAVSGKVDAIIILDQVDIAGTGVVSPKLLSVVRAIAKKRPDVFILADSRRGLKRFPPVSWKMNKTELSSLLGEKSSPSLSKIKAQAAVLARRNKQEVFVTLSEKGLLGASPDGTSEYLPAWPSRGKIDVVGAGDAVAANLASAEATGATMHESLEIANAAAAIVIHKLGTTGTASIEEIRRLVLKHSS